MRTITRDIVGAFIFSRDGCILLGQSGRRGVYQNQWLVPGGGVEPGETIEQAVIREILEETGLDMSNQKLVLNPGRPEGESQKTLRDTGETVLVKMKFYDFSVQFSKSAAELSVKAGDDLAKVEWINIAELPKLFLSPPTAQRLAQLGYEVRP
jgi:nucleoside triphosphatase